MIKFFDFTFIFDFRLPLTHGCGSKMETSDLPASNGVFFMTKLPMAAEKEAKECQKFL